MESSAAAFRCNQKKSQIHLLNAAYLTQNIFGLSDSLSLLKVHGRLLVSLYALCGHSVFLVVFGVLYESIASDPITHLLILRAHWSSVRDVLGENLTAKLGQGEPLVQDFRSALLLFADDVASVVLDLQGWTADRMRISTSRPWLLLEN